MLAWLFSSTNRFRAATLPLPRNRTSNVIEAIIFISARRDCVAPEAFLAGLTCLSLVMLVKGFSVSKLNPVLRKYHPSTLRWILFENYFKAVRVSGGQVEKVDT